MFLERDYRARAIGLMVAFVVLIIGIVTSQADEAAPAPIADHATQPASDRCNATC
jgi:hypothetical protein